MATRRSERLRQKFQANKKGLPPVTTKEEEQSHGHFNHNVTKNYKKTISTTTGTSTNSNNDSQERAAARGVQPPEHRPLKDLITRKDYEVQHWLDHGRLPRMPKINPFYAPYCARPKRRRLLTSRSQLVLQPNSPGSGSQEKRRIDYDSDDCVRHLMMNCCIVTPTEDKLTEAGKAACKTLLEEEWGGEPPTGTVFDENKIKRTMAWLALKSKIAIIHAIGELVVPSVDYLVDLDFLAGDSNEPWLESIPLEDSVSPYKRDEDPLGEKYYLPRPQPDYSVGFSRLAFTKKQLLKLKPFLSWINSTSFFTATMRIYFPFMVSEVEPDNAGPQVAQYQCMHSKALCLQGIIYLFRLVKREQELDRTILGYSIVYNSIDVSIYGYYPVINGPEITYHACEISSFVLNSETKWTSFKFVMAVYHKWAPLYLERICSAIEQLPESIISAEPAQSQIAWDSNDSGQLRDLAGSAEWSPSRRGSEPGNSSQEESVDIAESRCRVWC
ncbi:hypothetical protein BDW67DRAFT_184531 [Aspergillus spinulosporus]